jgi:monoamine oxidase
MNPWNQCENDRRDFLKTTVAGGLGLWVSQIAATSTARAAESGHKERVVIVGAGLAGLTAAVQLRSHGYDVTLLEARTRIGGRISTVSMQGHAVDLGAMWVEANPKNPVDQFCIQRGLKKIENDEDSVRVFDADGTGFGDSEAEHLHAHTQEILDRTQAMNKERIAAKQPDITMAEAVRVADTEQLNASRKQRYCNWAISAEVESTEAETIDRISLRNYWAEDEVEETFDANHYMLFGGLSQIPAILAQGLDIRLGQPVTSIRWAANGVEVATEKETFHADRVLVTLPIGVLKAGTVQFSPALPAEKLKVIQSVGVGAIHKVVLRFEKRFWRNDEQMFGYASETSGQFTEWWNYASLIGAPVLSLWSYGDAARRLEQAGPKTAVEEALKALQVVFKDAVTNPVESAVTNWNADPYSQGAHLYLPVGASYEQIDVLETPLGNRVFFAGEAVSRQFPATMHGAWFSGLREAEKIAKTK